MLIGAFKCPAMDAALLREIVAEVAGLGSVVYAGVFGSYARGRTEWGDIDLLLVTRGPLDMKSLHELAKLNVQVTALTLEELKRAPPELKYSITHGSAPLLGDLAEITDALTFTLGELRRAIHGDLSYHLYDAYDSLRHGDLRYACRAAYQAAVKASWLILVKHDLPIPNNAKEVMGLLSRLAETTPTHAQVLQDLKSTVLGRYDNVYQIFLSDIGATGDDVKEAINRASSFAAQVLRLSVTFESVSEDLEHAKRRIQEAEGSGDVRVLSDACQALFLVIYNAVSLYLASKAIVPPERHGDRFIKLEELSGARPEAKVIEKVYREAFDELHVAHYRRTCTVPLLRSWLTRTESFLEDLKGWI